MTSAAQVLRALMAEGPVRAPDAHDVMTAQLVEQVGFETVYVGSFGSAVTRWGLPDQSLVTMSQLLDHYRTVVDAVSIPVVVDFEDGGGNAVTCHHHVQAAARAGIAAIQIEDQIPGKGYGPVGDLYPIDIAAEKIRAAVDASADSGMVVIGRTEAIGVGRPVDEAIDRCVAYAEAGADLVTPSMARPDQFPLLRQRTDAPIATWVFGQMSPAEFAAAGFTLAIYPMHTTLVAYNAMRAFLHELQSTGNGVDLQTFFETVGEISSTNAGAANTDLARRYGIIE